MKKLLVLLGILAAFSFVACNKEADPVNPPASDPAGTEIPDTGDTGDTAETVITIKAKSSYGGPEWKVEDDWDSIKFDFAETPSNMQLKFTGDLVKAEQTWGTEYDAAYTGLIETTSIEKKFMDMIPYMEMKSTTVTHVSLVDMGKGDGVAKVKKVSVTKSDGTVQELEIPEANWGFEKN